MTQYKKNGKKLGVLGGLGPAASAEFLRQLAMRCPANCDQDHPVVYMIADCDIPDRGTAIFGKGESPLPMLKNDIFRLVDMGADVIAVPCNTAHFFIDQFKDELPVPLVHIIEETVLAAQKKSPEGAWMLSTTGTRKTGLYQKCAEIVKLYNLNPDEAILCYHGDDSESNYTCSAREKEEWTLLDNKVSKVRVILLAQIGKEVKYNSVKTNPELIKTMKK